MTICRMKATIEFANANPWGLQSLITIEGSLPRVKHSNTKIREILHVPGDNNEPVLESGCRDQAVRHVERGSSQSALAAQYAPAVSNSLGYRKDSPVKQRKEILFEPLLEFCAPLAL